MTSDLNLEEIRISLRFLVKEYVEEIKDYNELSQDFIDLIKHNFLAKYVIYNKNRKYIEIGIEDQDSTAAYPDIEIYSFPLDKAAEWLDKSFKKHQCDLEFYDRLLYRRRIGSSAKTMMMK